MERIAQLYKELTGREPQRITPLAGAGSNRQYFRVEGEGESLIAVIGTNQEENEAFIDLSKRFKQGNLPVPAVLAVSDDHMVYLQEDCGDLSLSAFMAPHRQEDGTLDEVALDALKATIRELPRFQFLPIVSQTASEFFTHCFPQQEMDRTSVMFDLNYFKYCFLKLKGVEFNEFKLQQDFEQLADDLLMEQADTFLYRDFQSRNIMLKDGKPYFIDFQGGRRGPIYYDVASFLWQSSAKFSDDVRNLLIEEYLQALQSQLSTLNCQLSTLNSQLSTVNCQLSTLNSQLSTLNFPPPSPPLCALPHLAGVRCIRLSWFMGKESLFHQQYSACHHQLAERGFFRHLQSLSLSQRGGRITHCPQ